MTEPLHIRPRPTKGVLELSRAEGDVPDVRVFDAGGNAVDCPVLERAPGHVWLDAAGLAPWTPDAPSCYWLEYEGRRERFGCMELDVAGNRSVLLNGRPVYLRGYIRGIVAHDHPNMTGGDRLAWHRKNVLQAKRYGFNLVRFHSTVPDDDFIRAADEGGLLVHVEIGFAFQFDAQGNKTGLALDQHRWTETLLRLRNAPSVAIFCIGNELHNAGRQPGVRELYEEGKRLAPGKLVMDNAGWGEFDRDTADVYCQHVAYFFPFKHHRAMFDGDFFWHLNGSAHGTPMTAEAETPMGRARLRRHATPARPTLAHEVVHYIDIPDYEKLNERFDAFAARVGPEYMAEYGIEKPRYLTELPALVRAKGIEDRMPDYIAASRVWRKMAVKTALERLRLSGLAGFEMLQFSDCLKYENKNGLVDFFDDDKDVDPAWFRRLNGDTVLLADWADETFYDDEPARVALHLSHFGAPERLTGALRLTLARDGRATELPGIDPLVVVPGRQKLCDLELAPERGTAAYRLKAVFEAEGLPPVENEWTFRVYARTPFAYRPANEVRGEAFRSFVEMRGLGPARADVVVTDVLDDAVFAHLAAGRTVLVCYHRDRDADQYYWPGALDRFKPCIWDRGNNLGGIVRPDWLRQALAMDRYFDLPMQPLVEGGYKVNLDRFPGRVDELVSGVDKPVRDRMKGLVQGVKDFLPDDTLRNFGYLFALGVDAGTLVVSTFSTDRPERPSAAAYYAALVDELPRIRPGSRLDGAELKAYLAAAKPVPEDVMNHFWERDDRPVEDTLFWEEAGVDLTKLH